MANYCEDYPCCGHTDGLGCNWTYTDEAREYDQNHAFCDHEAGFCDVWAYDYQDDEDEEDDDDEGIDYAWEADYHAHSSSITGIYESIE